VNTAAERPKRVLIVDDDESSRMLLERIVDSVRGLEITLADDGEAALKLATEHAYDLILLDLLMPGIGGIEALTRIRKSSANKASAVIIVSAMADPDTEIVCRSLGVKDYIVKPIRRDALIQAVRSALA